MKQIIFFLTFMFLISCKNEKKYCGPIIEMYRTDAGYKSSPEAHVVFYCDSIKKNIDIEVTFNCYANIKKDKHVCFILSDDQLER